ncbi:MAG: alpha/beta hydrolase [Lachnospiraceae bacterium]|nr:alpha/beta hydrolase [Lachnospiraceae bacterium]
MKVEKVYLYENRKDVSLTCYIWDDSREMLNGKARPAVLICPGGAYLGCSDREGEPIALRFASMGYHAFVLRYSVYDEGGAFVLEDPAMLGSLLPKKICQYPNPMIEVGMAMKFIHEMSDSWLVDTKRIAVCGFSAGAHNAAMFSTQWQTKIISDALGVDAEYVRPAACILGYTLSDYTFLSEYLKGELSPELQLLYAGYNISYTGTAVPTGDILDKISPAKNVSSFTPPTFLWATSEDNLVPVQNSIRMAHALADQKVPFEIHIFEKGPHGMALATQASAGHAGDMNSDAAKWVDLCDKWLEKRFAFIENAKDE